MITLNHIPLLLVHLAVYGGFWAVTSFEVSLAIAILGALLIWVSMVDFMIYEIPDTASALLVFSGLALHWGEGVLPYVNGAVLWAGVFWGMAIAARKALGQDGLGFGDVKLMAGLGAWLGPILPIYVVLCASVAAILTILVTQGGKSDMISRKAVAFGPFLCLSAWAVWLSGAGI